LHTNAKIKAEAIHLDKTRKPTQRLLEQGLVSFARKLLHLNFFSNDANGKMAFYLLGKFIFTLTSLYSVQKFSYSKK
jgi:hypothetical protein